jgi:uncharacterized membrane protein
MVRDTLRKHYLGLNKEFRYRGEEPGRLENFSDAVFALAITLLLISTSPPASFDQIKRFVWDLIPFCLCITFIILIWHEHFKFYFRYGLRNGRVLFLNTLFLIIVLFYVYPLKFLMKMVLFPIAYIFNQNWILQEMGELYKGTDMAYLMIIYGTGATGVFLVLMFMYLYALKNAVLLELNEIEKFDTRASMQINFLMALIPFISVIIAFAFNKSVLGGMYAGLFYFLYPPAIFAFTKYVQRKRKKLLQGEIPLDDEAI